MMKTKADMDFGKIYVDWLKQNIDQYKVNETTYRITLPFLDRNNDHIEMYIIDNGNETYTITDDGATLGDLQLGGFEFSGSTRRKMILESIISAHGVTKTDADELTVNCTVSDFPLKKHMLAQCMIKVGDMFYLSRSNIQSVFLEDVQKFFDLHDVRYVDNICLTGKSKLTTHFDFAIARSHKSAERFIKVVNNMDLNAARNRLYEKYRMLISGNTPTHSRLDINRMFHKVLNIYAVENHIPGSRGKYPASYSDLMYNRKNWRDTDKDKSVTRQQALSKEMEEKQEVINNYYVQKAIALIRKIQKESEVHDAWGNGTATQVHHIFPRSQFPQIAHYVENLILLTATQHNTKAHPDNNTQLINKDYQLVCLLAKADTIEKSLAQVGDRYYRKESFIYVINVGLHSEFSVNLTFVEIKEKLVKLYNAA